jgi:hypothetical protein
VPGFAVNSQSNPHAIQEVGDPGTPPEPATGRRHVNPIPFILQFNRPNLTGGSHTTVPGARAAIRPLGAPANSAKGRLFLCSLNVAATFCRTCDKRLPCGFRLFLNTDASQPKDRSRSCGWEKRSAPVCEPRVSLLPLSRTSRISPQPEFALHPCGIHSFHGRGLIALAQIRPSSEIVAATRPLRPETLFRLIQKQCASSVPAIHHVIPCARNANPPRSWHNCGMQHRYMLPWAKWNSLKPGGLKMDLLPLDFLRRIR